MVPTARCDGAFQLGLKTTGEDAVRDLHLDVGFKTEVEGTSLITGDLAKAKPSSPVYYPGSWMNAQASEPVPGPSWRMEQDVPVVQVDRTVTWGPRLGWITARDGSLDIQITVYNSSAPPFGLTGRVNVRTEEQIMTYSEILDAAGVTPHPGRG